MLRHQLIREGASFRVEDEIFLDSNNPDFHPTDVLEDGDGSLLVVETGGWFILGCPLSQVSKPQLRGAIYRISKKDGSRVKNPYGNNLDWAGMTSNQVAEYLTDPRPIVADRAQRELIDRGPESSKQFSDVLNESGLIQARIRATFGLYQLHTAKSLKALETAFQDEALEVRLAAARAAGLTGSTSFIPALVSQLGSDQPSEIRQALTALGQIGESSAIEAIMETVDSVNDRFVDHALKYALIVMDQPEILLNRLPSATDKQIETILVAVDQMSSGALTADVIMPYLAHPSLNATALWVASHHPEWAPEIIGFLREKAFAGGFTEEECQVYSQLMVNYCQTPEMQYFLADMMVHDDKSLQHLALDNMGKCQIDSSPGLWNDALSKLLQSSVEPGVLMQAVRLVKLRGLSGFTKSWIRFRITTICRYHLELKPSMQDCLKMLP